MLKALLAAQGEVVPRTHDLIASWAIALAQGWLRSIWSKIVGFCSRTLSLFGIPAPRLSQANPKGARLMLPRARFTPPFYRCCLPLKPIENPRFAQGYRERGSEFKCASSSADRTYVGRSVSPHRLKSVPVMLQRWAALAGRPDEGDYVEAGATVEKAVRLEKLLRQEGELPLLFGE